MDKTVAKLLDYRPKSLTAEIGKICRMNAIHDTPTSTLVIIPIEVENIVGLPCYKKYVYTIPEGHNEYCLETIMFNGVKQEGLPESITNFVEISVYYWKHDYKNYRPLLFEIVREESQYFANYEIGSNTWEPFSINGRVKLYGILAYLNAFFRDIIVLKMDALAGKYFGTNFQFGGGDRLMFVDEFNCSYKRFRRMKHTLYTGSTFRILHLRMKGIYIPFKESVLTTECIEASVYYMCYDKAYKEPLFLELLSHNGPRYYRYDGFCMDRFEIKSLKEYKQEHSITK
ncbi:hypothetical protein BEWA_000530 [Theileria equi strain WA]|uniref:Uncharacterized protein n=1 Tax=Theileria equi strain WA TaxID=1537102 RepID=L0AZF0_THEEQ|nr:hypothetical protein BEWA_000530 [Theileria equi strain WA]AFZ80648.1 hypothetical protein BEWA_000530 [Theileria equi strain WA]|eukprot:XP_004830314.1 hypothetical protein BEWA_000530 [Theileria equi strain WA]